MATQSFLSVEPLLEDLGIIDLRGISWVIVGGESGPGARSMDEAWVRSIRQATPTASAWREAGKRCGLKDGAALMLKRRIASDLIEFFGEDVIQRLLDGVQPGWESDLRTSRERHSYLANAARQVTVPDREG